MMRTVTLVARPAITEPSDSATSVATIMCSLPRMSPTRPMTGVKIDADSKYAVTTQVTVFWLVCIVAWMVVSAGITRDCRSAYADTPRTSTPKVTL